MSYLSNPTSPNGKLYVGNVKWSNDYKHVMLFASASARNSFFTTNLTKIKENVIYYQPKYNLKKGKYGGAEALVRWHKKDGSIVPPSEFISFFEKKCNF